MKKTKKQLMEWISKLSLVFIVIIVLADIIFDNYIIGEHNGLIIFLLALFLFLSIYSEIMIKRKK